MATNLPEDSEENAEDKLPKDVSNDEANQAQETEADAQADADEAERMMLLSQADEVKGMQLFLGETGEFTSEPELRAYALSEGPRDPERMYDLYYKGVEKLLLRFLPSGNSRSEKYARRVVREEKIVYLTRGYRLKNDGRRGADSRMGHPEDAETILNIVVDWAMNSRNAADLYMRLRDLNIRMGYGIPKNG